MANEAYVSLIGFVATQPKKGRTKSGSPTLSMRVGWTPRTVDRDTGAWSDLPSSFLTVTCYRKVAEHASVCLRRGEPIVVRGTLRVREYVDQNGQRRSSVDVQADSIGHDMSRGISNYSKLSARAEPTAEEYEQSQAAAVTRNPLPGDVARAAADGGGVPDRDAAEEPGLGSDATPGVGGAGDSDLAGSEEYDEPEDEDEPVSAGDPLEPVGALA